MGNHGETRRSLYCYLLVFLVFSTVSHCVSMVLHAFSMVSHCSLLFLAFSMVFIAFLKVFMFFPMVSHGFFCLPPGGGAPGSNKQKNGGADRDMPSI